MKKALLIALMCIVPFKPNFTLLKTLEEQRFIEENNLVRVKVSCYYAEPGARTADGSVPIEGMVSSNTEHLGMDMVLYTDDLMPEARFQCTDVGGHALLRNGKAVDFYRDNYERCVSFVKSHSEYVWVKWIQREEEVSDE